MPGMIELPPNTYQLNKTERAALAWLLDEKDYSLSELVRENAQQSPDFVFPDEKYEVKRLQGNKILVSPRQDRIFARENPLIIVMLETESTPEEVFRWSDRETADTPVHVYDEDHRVQIRCGKDTRREWKKIWADIDPDASQEEILECFIDAYREEPDLFERVYEFGRTFEP